MNDGSLAHNVLEEIADKNLLVGDDFKEIYRIGDLAREFDVSLRTLRFYEDRGLISPQRSGSTRLYSQDDRARLKIILLAKSVGFSLVDIQELLAIYDGGEGDVERLKGKFSEQLAALHAKKNEIDRSIVQVHEALKILGTS